MPKPAGPTHKGTRDTRTAAPKNSGPADPRDWAPPRWLRITLPAVLLLIWLTLAGIGGPTFGKISSVSTNDQASFLPASAESTEVRAWQQKFTDSDAIPAIVLLVADAPIPQSALADYVQLGNKLAAVDGVVAALADAGRGFVTAGGVVPIVSGMSLFDLTVGSSQVRPGAAEGAAAAGAHAGCR